MIVKDRAATKKPMHTNGATKSEKVAEASKPKADASKKEADQSEKKTEPEPAKAAKVIQIVTASDRLNKLEQFTKLKERHDFLKAKDNELKNFSISQDGTAAKIHLECQGAKVVVTNSTIIEKVVNLCQEELNSLLVKTEAEVISFDI